MAERTGKGSQQLHEVGLIVLGVLSFVGISVAVIGGGDDAEMAAATQSTTAPALPTANRMATETRSEIDSVPEAQSDLVSVPGADPEAVPAPEPAPEVPSVPREHHTALRSAELSLNYTAFSQQGLVEKLEVEDHSTEAARFAVETVDADWMAQAVEKGEQYMEFSPFSRQRLIDQLMFGKFSAEQAQYAADQLY